MFYASRGVFASGIMVLTETGERDTIPIGDLTLFDVMVKQVLGFDVGDSSNLMFEQRI